MSERYHETDDVPPERKNPDQPLPRLKPIDEFFPLPTVNTTIDDLRREQEALFPDIDEARMREMEDWEYLRNMVVGAEDPRDAVEPPMDGPDSEM